MGQWIEIPAHRIYVVGVKEIHADFEVYGEDGEPIKEGEKFGRLVRKKDGRVFKLARALPMEFQGMAVTPLEEI